MDEKQNVTPAQTPGQAPETPSAPAPAPVAPPPPAPEATKKPDLKANTSILSRREFITLLIGAGATLVAAATLAEPLATMLGGLPAGSSGHGGEDSGVQWAMVIDLSKCVGCHYCVYACQATNDTRTLGRWNILITDETSQGNTFYLTRNCLQCTNAPCVSVCPVGATYKRSDGLVMMDYSKCIGCRYCQAACPYGARVFNWTDREALPNPMVPEWGTSEVPPRPRGVVEKCTFCVQRIDYGVANGLTPGVDPEATPACVNICPVTARFFGNIKDPNSTVAKIVSTRPTLRLREDLGTEPNVYYIPPEGMI
ncbi:MAG: 4Fe-4S dicluster domain-containing protein [Anaerolineae bacterium]